MTTIGLVGGTGDLGTALAVHLAKQFEVILGSRDMEKAKSAIQTVRSEKSNPSYLEQHLSPANNETVVRSCDVVILTVPYESALDTIRTLVKSFHEGQLLISAAAVVKKSGDEFVADFGDQSKSISQQIAEVLPSYVEVATAFQTVPARRLYREDTFSSDVLVAADRRATYERVAKIVSEIQGLRPLYLGSLRLSGEIESLTSLLLNIAKRNDLKSPTMTFSSF